MSTLDGSSIGGKMKFYEGEEVLARNPETAEYSKGKILSVRGERYKIQFEPGTEHTVHQNDVKLERPSRSTTRMSTRVGRKSPSRYSPSRKSPGRRSPGRPPTVTNRKLPVRSTRLAKISLSRIEISNDRGSNEKTVSAKSTNEDDSPTELMPLQSRLKDVGSVTRRSTRLFSSTPKTESDHRAVILTRNIDRAVSLPLERKSQLHEFDGKERGQSVQRDQDLLKSLNYEEDVHSDTEIIEKRKKEITLVSEPQEWGGWIGTIFLIILFPLCVILPQLVCTKNQCKFDYLNIPTDLKSYIDLNAFFAYIGFFTFVTSISIIPIGKCVDGQQSKIGRLQYRMNGLLCAILLIIAFSACIYEGIKISDFILENVLQLALTGWLLGTILSIILYIKASKAPVANLNIYASTTSVIYNFWQGREVNPRIGPLDFKMILLRISLIGKLIINLAIMVKSVEETESLSIEHVNIAALLATSLQIFYVMDMLIFESTLLTTFEVMYEGTGYMLCTGHMLYPFLPTLTTRYLLYQETPFSYILGIFLLTFISGYVLYRVSNSQKDEFRRNPLSQTVDHLETIPTTRGKKLILSGLWGYVRHPNYLGDVIMQWSIACISLTRDILPYYPAICCTIALAYRAIRDNERCKVRYGLAWEQYSSRAKYMILNRIF